MSLAQSPQDLPDTAIAHKLPAQTVTKIAQRIMAGGPRDCHLMRPTEGAEWIMMDALRQTGLEPLYFIAATPSMAHEMEKTLQSQFQSEFTVISSSVMLEGPLFTPTVVDLPLAERPKITCFHHADLIPPAMAQEYAVNWPGILLMTLSPGCPPDQIDGHPLLRLVNGQFMDVADLKTPSKTHSTLSQWLG